MRRRGHVHRPSTARVRDELAKGSVFWQDQFIRLEGYESLVMTARHGGDGRSWPQFSTKCLTMARECGEARLKEWKNESYIDLLMVKLKSII